MQIFSSTRIKLFHFTQILGKCFNLVSVSAKIYAGDVLDRFNIRTRIPPPVNSRSKEGRRYLAASSVSLRRRGVGRSVCWRNRCRRKRIPDHILPRCVRFSVYVTWSLLSKEVERRTGCEIVSPNRAKKKNSASITKPILSPRLAPILSNQRARLSEGGSINFHLYTKRGQIFQKFFFEKK